MKNLQYLATELFKVKNDLSPEIMKEIFVFQKNESYNLKSANHLARKEYTNNAICIWKCFKCRS